MKKSTIPVALALVVAVMSGCFFGKDLKVVKDAGGSEYIKKMYGGGVAFLGVFSVKVIDKSTFEQMKQMDREQVIQDRSLSDAAQKKKVDEIDARQYEENKYYMIYIVSDKQLLNAELRFGIEIRTAKGVNVADKGKGMRIFESSGMDASNAFNPKKKFYYSIMFSSTKPLTKKFFGNDELPGQLWFQFPNNSILVYAIE